MQMENIGSYIEATRALGVPAEYLFMTVDLFERKNLAQVALNIVSVKRQLGLGFQKQSAGPVATVLDIPARSSCHSSVLTFFSTSRRTSCCRF